MRLAIVADLHMISQQDEFHEIRRNRSFFSDAWPSFQGLCKKIRDEAPDLVISLGDLVDWYSDENRDFALEMLDELKLPWVMTPGNHDFEMYTWEGEGGKIGRHNSRQGYATANQGWKARGIETNNRFIEAEGTGLLLMNSAFSDVPPGTREWLHECLEKCGKSLLFTHVPLNVAMMRDYILSVEPDRNLIKYVQHYAPWVYEQGAGRVKHVLTGHLHFPGEVHVGETRMHMLGMGITELRKPDKPASAFIWNSSDPDCFRRISV